MLQLRRQTGARLITGGRVLMQAAAMVTAEFMIIAEANDYWRGRSASDFNAD